ncbi:MAG: XRE family transcriptional regulator [Paludibacteraceae bacterium]|jgi:transcriptional regulator with XRE-family HTH domain|nr:XRE family transcriptional regulator [Paludibacteraceae bacterium]
MNEQIKQIAERLKGLRESLDLNIQDIAAVCGISADEYASFESGDKDIPVSVLHNISKKYGVEMTSLLFGEDPHMTSYYLTRKGQGTAMERSKAYKYQSLAAGFMNRQADPFIVTVEPNDNPIHLNSHAGQEFNLILEGRMLLNINGKELVLEEGDSIYFDSASLHGMKALDNKTVKFLAVII